MLIARILRAILLMGGAIGAAFFFRKFDRELPDAVMGFVFGVSLAFLAMVIAYAIAFIAGFI